MFWRRMPKQWQLYWHGCWIHLFVWRWLYRLELWNRYVNINCSNYKSIHSDSIEIYNVEYTQSNQFRHNQTFVILARNRISDCCLKQWKVPIRRCVAIPSILLNFSAIFYNSLSLSLSLSVNSDLKSMFISICTRMKFYIWEGRSIYISNKVIIS